MTKQLQKNLIENIQKIIPVSLVDIETVLPILESSIKEFTDYTSTLLAMEPIHQPRKIKIDTESEEYGINLGIKRSDTNISIQKWIFELQQRTRGYILTFVVVKESLMQFLINELNELEETIINIATLLWLKQLYNFKTIDSPIVASVTSRIYPETISGLDYHLINNLFEILFIKNVSFDDLFKTYLEIKKEYKPDENELYKRIRQWVQNFIKDNDVIAPIYIRQRLIPIIDNLLELGYEKGTTNVFAKLLNVHENTARNYFREMTTNYTTFWRPIINFERLKLHNYFYCYLIAKF